MRWQIGEVFAKIFAAENDDEKLKLFAENSFPVVREIVKLNYGIDPFVALPDTAPPYNPSNKPYPYNDAKLFTAWKMFRIFRSFEIRRMVVETRFIQLLEALNAEEAKLLLDAHLHQLDFGLSDTGEARLAALFNIAIPDRDAVAAETVETPEDHEENENEVLGESDEKVEDAEKVVETVTEPVAELEIVSADEVFEPAPAEEVKKVEKPRRGRKPKPRK